MKILLFLTLTSLLLSCQAAHWAVLIAGSDEYDDYRHQADVYHAYQVLTRKGMKPENIITFAYDNIAHNEENPFPGQVFNRPDGEDVYAGVKIDYRGKEVNPQNFLNVIQGNADQVAGRVLNSTSEDNVFIYFADHGAPGLIRLPEGKYLYADNFIQALKNMYSKKMYKEMVIYIEACESGSMFENLLPDNLNIYATTAANSTQSSWATYCWPEDKVNGKHVGACLGDEYSVSFLENLEIVDSNTETLELQFETIKSLTKGSHVQKFGDFNIAKESINSFQGDRDEYSWKFSQGLRLKQEDQDFKTRSSVDSREVKLHYLKAKKKRVNSLRASMELNDELMSIKKVDNVFCILRSTLNIDTSAGHSKINFDCLKNRMNLYEAMCGKFSDYGLKYVRNILQTCQQGVDQYDFEQAVFDACYNMA